MFSRFNMQTMCVVAALALLTCAGHVYGQGLRGAIVGVVHDSSGALVPGVEITVTNTETRASVKVPSGANGAYLAPQLLPGEYRLTASSGGFKQTNAGPVKVDVGTTATQDFVLEVGGVTETVSVVANTQMLETTSSTVGTTVATKQILEMPLVDRNVFTLANLVPGSFWNAGRGTASLGGGRIQEATAMLDGTYNSNGGLGTQGINISPSVDAIQEFKVEVNNLSAQYGRTSGGMVNAVTKSGTNQFRGVFYEFLRNDKLDAAGWGADSKPPLRRNNFGASVGGPVVKNKTFFFYNLESLRERRPGVTTRNVGLPEWRSGDFSTATRDAGGVAAAAIIYDPNTGDGTATAPHNTSPFPGNRIPSNRLDPVAVKALSYLANPNRTPDNPFSMAGNWQENLTEAITSDLHTMRIDHQINANTNFFGRYTLNRPSIDRLGSSASFGPSDPNLGSTENGRQNLSLNLTHVFSPSFFVTAGAGVSRGTVLKQAGGCCDTNFGQQFGLPNLPGGDAFPRFDLAGGIVPITDLGVATAFRAAAFTNFDYLLDFTRVTGRHTLKFGAHATTYNGNDHKRATPSGRYSFTERYTQGVDAKGAAIKNTGIRMADFLLGKMDRLRADVAPSFGHRLQYYAGYLQDDFRVRSNFTLNLGIRYDLDTPQYEVNNRISTFDPYAPNPLAGTGDIPSNARGVMVFAGRNGHSKYLTQWDRNNFAPRVGFAWRPFGAETVIRGGYGVFFGNPFSTQTVQNLRVGFGTTFDLRSPTSTLRNGLPANALDPVPESELLPTFGNRGTRFETSTIDFLNPYRATPYNQNFNFNVQHQFRTMLVEVGYVGNLGRHVTYEDLNYNLIPAALLSQTTTTERLRRPYTIFGSDTAVIDDNVPSTGISNYHALTVKVERRFHSGVGWMLAYTLSKWIDNVPFIGSTASSFGDSDGLQNVNNMAGERSLSTNHVPHRLVFSPIVDLPFGKGRHFMNRGGILNAAFGGWQVSTIATLQSGSPFGVTVLNGGRTLLGDMNQVLRADLVGSSQASTSQGDPASGVRGLQWLNSAAFASPARYTYGNESRTLPNVLGPGLINFDTLMSKNFEFLERYRVQFRWEMFNAANTPKFDLPAQDLGGTNFGVITSATSRRIMQFGLKLYW